jgi:hypothetical protein
MLTMGSDSLEAQSIKCHMPSWPASLFLPPPLQWLTTGLPLKLKLCKGALEALSVELRTRALSDKAHTGPSLWKCRSTATVDYFIFRCNVHS